MNMKYTINEWCATCGKAKQYSGVLSDGPSTIVPEMCECNNTVSVRPVNSAPPAYVDYTAFISSPNYLYAYLCPENMQALETMMRRVVAEELAKRHLGE